MQVAWFVPYLPLLGVVVGWLLNELAARLRARGDTHRRLGETVAVLISLRQEITNIITTWESYKDYINVTSVYETMRKRAVDRAPFFNMDDACEKRLDEAVRTSSGVNPVLGYRL